MPQELDQGKVVAAIRQATGDVFSTMLGVELTSLDAYRQPCRPEAADGVIGLVGLTGRWTGTGSIACTGELARKISGQFLMSEFASVDQEVLDAMGEITNMIIGNFKNALEEETGPLGMSIPMVVFGHNFTAGITHSADWVVAPFACDGGRLEVKACLFPQPEKQSHRRPASAPDE
ncbi:MAG TPA: chemotaxis protein CheX [Bryobacteraceae bacterium]|nr:chemotaxis protein CheX [Bryobacteraceae bacterium]